MRKIEIIIPKDKVDETKETLNRLFYEYNIIEGTDEALVIIFTDISGSKTTLEELKRIGISTTYGRINILPIAGLIPPLRGRAEQRPKIQSLSFEELYSIIEPQTHPDLLYIVFIIVSAIVAALGLIYNNVAVIVGSMVIAPLLGPIVGSSLGTVTSNRKILKRGLFTEFVGLTISIMVGLLLGFLFYYVGVLSNGEFEKEFGGRLSEMFLRTNATLADFGLGIASGIAAGLCFVSGIATALVGVAVAASLMPPAANVGLLLSMGEFGLAVGSLWILLINLLCINFMCTITFFLSGIKSPVQSKRMEKLRARTARKDLLIVLAALIILAAAIILALF
ncbi:MAG: TIGR00341 family protein [Candidatus Helarchaeota archaeon]|nr:TIGR00341 family protein [Candidatus Helarchaeota archaeon]